MRNEFFDFIDFSFGILASKLIKGGGDNEFEDHFKWIIHANIDFSPSKVPIDQLESMDDFNEKPIRTSTMISTSSRFSSDSTRTIPHEGARIPPTRVY
jgi:hypothetical protein